MEFSISEFKRKNKKETHIMTELGARLAGLREEKKLTQKKLANLLNMSGGTISNYENGVHSPDPSTLCRLADFYGVTTDYLLGRTNYRYPPDVLREYVTTDYTIQDMVNILLSFDPASRSAVIKYVNYLNQELKTEREQEK